MISPNASNWVFRGEPPEPTLTRVLSSYLHLDLKAHAQQLAEYVGNCRGMSEADSTEVQVAGYLRDLEARHGIDDRMARHRRAVAIAIWHIVKCAEVRDRAVRLLSRDSEAAT